MSTSQLTTDTTPIMIKRPSPPECPPRPAPGASRFQEHLDDDPTVNSPEDFPRFWEQVDSEQWARDLFWVHLKWIYDPHPPEVQDDWIFTNEEGIPMNEKESLRVNVARVDSPMHQEFVIPEAPWDNSLVERGAVTKEKKNRSCGQKSMGKFLNLFKIDFESVPLPAFLLDRLSRRRPADAVHEDVEMTVLQRPEAARVRPSRPVSLRRDDLPSRSPVRPRQTEHQNVQLAVPDQPSKTAAVRPMRTRRPGKSSTTEPVQPTQPSKPTRPSTPTPRQEESVLHRPTNVCKHRSQQHSKDKPRPTLPRAEEWHPSNVRHPHVPLSYQEVQDMLSHTAAVEQSNALMLASRNREPDHREFHARRTPLPAPTHGRTDRRDSAQEKPVEMKERVSETRRATRRAIIAATSVGVLYEGHVSDNNSLKHGAQVRPAAHRVIANSDFSDSDSSESDDQALPAARPAELRMTLSSCFSDSSDGDDSTTGHEIPGAQPTRNRMALSDTSWDHECEVPEVRPAAQRMAHSDCCSDCDSNSLPMGSDNGDEVDCSWLGIIAKHGPVSSRRSSSSCFSVGSFDSDDKTDVSQPTPTGKLFSDPSPAAWESYGPYNDQPTFEDSPNLRWTKPGEYIRLRNPNLTIKVPRVDSGYAVHRSPDLDLDNSPLLSPLSGHVLTVMNASLVLSSPDSYTGLEDIPFVEDSGWLGGWREEPDLIFLSEDQACRAQWAHLWEDPYEEPIDQSLFADFDGDFTSECDGAGEWSDRV